MANPSQDELLAELDKLEKSTLKKGGDALQNAPHDGGFATQGTNIQEKAKKMYKALRKGGFSKKEAKKAVYKAFGDEESSSDESSAMSSVEKAIGSADSMSSDDASGDDESSDGTSSEDESSDESSAMSSPMKKSTGAAAMANAVAGAKPQEDSIRKALTDEHPDVAGALDAVPILGQLIDAIDRMAKGGGKSSKKALGSIRKALVAESEARNDFNSRLAKALVHMTGRMIGIEDLVKKMASEPVNTGNRQPSLRKSDLQQPSFHDGGTQRITGGNGDPNQVSPLTQLPYLQIQEALTELCMKGGAELMDITKFENSKGDLRLLPPNVIEQLEKRLCAAA